MFLTGPAFPAALPNSLIFASTAFAISTGNFAASPTAFPALPRTFKLSPPAFAESSAPLKIASI